MQFFSGTLTLKLHGKTAPVGHLWVRCFAGCCWGSEGFILSFWGSLPSASNFPLYHSRTSVSRKDLLCWFIFASYPPAKFLQRIVVFKLKSSVYVTGKLQKRPAWCRTLIAKLIKVDSVRCVNKCQSGSWGWSPVNEDCGGGSSAVA